MEFLDVIQECGNAECQSQVSVIISCGVFIFFALLVFLSGYVHQQRTVTGLQEALKPRLPKPPPSISTQEHQPRQPDLQPSRFFGGGGHVAYTNPSKADDVASANVNWNKLAHIQLVRTHHDMCNAIMVLAELHRLKSPARRVLLFPHSWAMEKMAGKGDISDPFLAITRRLMKSAARRYGIELRPVAPVVKSADGEEKDVYSLASAYSLTDLDRVLSIETPGLIMDASPLDAVLAFTESAPFAMLHDTTEGDGVHAEDLFLMTPSAEIHRTFTKHFETHPSFNDTLLSTSFPDFLLLSSKSEDTALIRSIGTLHDAGSARTERGSNERGSVSDLGSNKVLFNTTAFLSTTSYILFSDPKLPGPEYDVPWADKVAARPKDREADYVWTKLYAEFQQKRMEVCGLDLEVWRP